MLEKTLYLVQSNYANTSHVLNKLVQIYDYEDVVVLMGESILFINDTKVKNFHQVYVLENDIELLAHSVSDYIQMLNYAQFADLVLTFKRSISLK